MDIVSLIIQLVIGAVGGNLGGAVVKNASLGTTGNSVVGAIGGIILGQIVERMTGGAVPAADATAAATSGGIGDIIQNVIGGGAGGAILTVIAGLIKNSMAKG